IISFISLIIFFIIGIISMIFSGIHKDYIYSFVSGLLTIKPLIIYFIVRQIYNTYKIDENILPKCDEILSYILLTFFTIAMLDLIFNFLPSAGVRNGIKSIAMGFNHPAIFEFCIITIMIIKLFIKTHMNLPLDKFYITIVEVSILVFLGGRSKGIAFMGLFVLCFIVIKYFKRFKMSYIIMSAPLLVVLAYDRIVTSLLSSDEARNVLYRTSFKIANDFFPLGTGFSTFGSEFSRVRYSSIYEIYNIDKVWGLAKDKPKFVTDTQWASILGETGYLGMIAYSICILLILYLLYKLSKKPIEQLALTSLFIYGLLSSISDSILVSYRGTAIFLIVAIFISLKVNNGNSINIDISKLLKTIGAKK
ncbi:MAG: hypothetical protein ACRCXA_04525, partial [Peptostreptococcaceae bacterium]